MSVQASTHVWALELPANEKLVALCMAEHADPAGGSIFPSLPRVAAMTGYSRENVRRLVRKLEDAGVIVKVRDAEKQRAVEYAMPLDRPPTPPQDVGGAAQDPPHHGGGTPHTTVDRTVIEPSSGAKAPDPVRAPVPAREAGLPVMIGRIRTTAAEVDIASAAMCRFNQLAGTAYSLAAHGATIIRRAREHPELSANDHHAIIEAQFAAPWWKDKPAPSVIYGNAAVFERSMERWRSGPGSANGAGRATMGNGWKLDTEAIERRSRDRLANTPNEGTTT